MGRCALAIGLVFCLGAPARGQEDARAFFERGAAQFALGKFADAAGNFERSFELKPDPAILYNAAQARRLSGNQTRALELYSSYLRLYGARVENRAEVQRHIEDLRAAIARDRRVASSPPIAVVDPRTHDQPAARSVEPVAAPRAPAPEPLAVVAVAPPPRARPRPVRRAVVWGVVAGAAAAIVVVGVSLGVAYGTPRSRDPDPTFGVAHGE